MPTMSRDVSQASIPMALEGFLRESMLFKGIDVKGLRPFLSLCRQVSVEEGEYLFKEGDTAQYLYIVGRGRVALHMALERPDGSFTGPTTVASIGPGDAFGWSAVVEPHVLTLSARAAESSDLIRIDGEALLKALAKHRDVGYRIMANVTKLLADRLQQTREAFVYLFGWPPSPG